MPNNIYDGTHSCENRDGSSEKKRAEYAKGKQERLAIYAMLEANAKKRKRDAENADREEKRLRDHFGDLIR